MRRLIHLVVLGAATGVLIGAAMLEFESGRFASTSAFVALAFIAAKLTFDVFLED